MVSQALQSDNSPYRPEWFDPKSPTFLNISSRYAQEISEHISALKVVEIFMDYLKRDNSDVS